MSYYPQYSALIGTPYVQTHEYCTGPEPKRKYPMAASAWNAAKALMKGHKHGKKPLHGYRCDYCQGWHAGHSHMRNRHD